MWAPQTAADFICEFIIERFPDDPPTGRNESGARGSSAEAAAERTHEFHHDGGACGREEKAAVVVALARRSCSSCHEGALEREDEHVEHLPKYPTTTTCS